MNITIASVRKVLFVQLFFVMPFTVMAQDDPLYNQYLFNQGMINPAYCGINKSFNVMAISRIQWAGIDGAPVTNTLHLSSSLRDDRLGAGITVLNDKLGVSSTTELSAAFNYRILFLNGSKLSFGMQGALVNFRYDYSKLNSEVVDQRLTQALSNFSQPNIGVGVFYKTEKFYLGLSIPRLLDVIVQDGISTSTRYRKHAYLSGGFVIDRFNSFKLKPSALVRYVEGALPTFDLNVQGLFFEVLWAGLTTRNLSTVGLISQLEVSEKFRVGYLFEYPLSALAATNFATHELMLSLDLSVFRHQVAYRRYF